MKVSIDLDDMVHFRQGLDTLDDFERKMMFDAAGIAQDRILTQLRTYPAQQRRKLPPGIPKSRAQARKIAMLIKAGKVPYQRTGAHAGGWQSSVTEVSQQSGSGTTFHLNFENAARGVETQIIETSVGNGLSKRSLQDRLGSMYAARLRLPGSQYRMFRGYWANMDTIMRTEGKFIREAFRDAAAFLGRHLVRR